MGSIANLAVKITADAAGLSAGIAKGIAEIDRFAGAVTSKLGGLGAPVAGILTGAGFVEAIREGLNEVKSFQTEAAKLNVSIGSVAAMSRIAGGDMEGFSHGLMHMRATIGQALIDPAGEAAQALGGLGLSADKLSGMGTEGAFKSINASLGRLGEFTRASQEKTIFGRGGIEAEDTMNRVAASLDKVKREMVETGQAPSIEDALKARDALRSIHEIDETWHSVKRTLAVEVAPIITLIGHDIQGWIGHIGGFKNIIHETVSAAVPVIDQLSDSIKTLGDGLDRLNQAKGNGLTGEWLKGTFSPFAGDAGDRWVRQFRRSLGHDVGIDRHQRSHVRRRSVCQGNCRGQRDGIGRFADDHRGLYAGILPTDPRRHRREPGSS